MANSELLQSKREESILLEESSNYFMKCCRISLTWVFMPGGFITTIFGLTCCCILMPCFRITNFWGCDGPMDCCDPVDSCRWGTIVILWAPLEWKEWMEFSVLQQVNGRESISIQTAIKCLFLRNTWCNLLSHLLRCNWCCSNLVNGRCNCCTLWNACAVVFVVRSGWCGRRWWCISCFWNCLLQWNSKETIISSRIEKKQSKLNELWTIEWIMNIYRAMIWFQRIFFP